MLLEAGRIAADGPAAQVVARPEFERVFGVRFQHERLASDRDWLLGTN